MRLPSIGRIVRYRLDSGPNRGEYRPAIIVRVWSDHPDSSLQLQVLTDASNDGMDALVWRTSVPRGDEPGQWGWPPYVPETPDVSQPVHIPIAPLGGSTEGQHLLHSLIPEGRGTTFSVSVTDYPDGRRSAFVCVEGEEYGAGISAGAPREALAFVQQQIAAHLAEAALPIAGGVP